jgi:phage baseplate assembly protein W
MNIAFPFHVDDRHRTASTGLDDHIHQLIEQLVFTSPGERVNRPTFGAGIQQLVFAPNSPELATALQFLVQGSLQLHLGDLIEVSSVEVDSIDSTLVVNVAYVDRATQRPASNRLEVVF